MGCFRHEEATGFGRKPKTKRAQLVVQEAKRAINYITERQQIEKINIAANEENIVASDELSVSSFMTRYAKCIYISEPFG